MNFGYHITTITESAETKEYYHEFVKPEPLSYESVAEEAAAVEKMGFEAVFVPEHHSLDVAIFPPIVTLAGMVHHVNEARLGSNIMILPLHHPISVAEDFAMLDVMSGGRMILGVAIGYVPHEYEVFGASWKDRGDVLEEQVKIIRSLWTEPRVTYDGKYYKIRNAAVNPKPIQRNLPIWIGASGAAPRRAVERIARVGDAWIADQTTPVPRLKEQYEIYRDAVKRYGKDYDMMQKVMIREAMIGKDNDTASRNAELYLVSKYKQYFRWGLPAVKAYGFKNADEIDLDSLQKRGLRAIMGSPDDCIRVMEEYIKEFDPDLMIIRGRFPGFSQEIILENARLWGKVISYFKNKQRS